MNFTSRLLRIKTKVFIAVFSMVLFITQNKTENKLLNNIASVQRMVVQPRNKI